MAPVFFRAKCQLRPPAPHLRPWHSPLLFRLHWKILFLSQAEPPPTSLLFLKVRGGRFWSHSD